MSDRDDTKTATPTQRWRDTEKQAEDQEEIAAPASQSDSLPSENERDPIQGEAVDAIESTEISQPRVGRNGFEKETSPAEPYDAGGEGSDTTPDGDTSDLSAVDSPTSSLDSVDPLGPHDGNPEAMLSDETEDAWASYDDSATKRWLPLTAEGDADDGVSRPTQYASWPSGTDHQCSGVTAATHVAARLLGLIGVDRGQRFTIDNREMSIGRGAANGLRLAEPSVSREHARLLFDGDRYLLIDNRSANGTFVNGERIDRARLHSGDEVAFGHGKYRFLEIAEGVEIDEDLPDVEPSSPDALPSPQGPPRVPRLARVLGVVLLGAAALGAVAVFAVQGGHLGISLRTSHDRVSAHFTAGVEAFNTHRWDEAEKEFTAVLSLEPTHKRSQEYLQQIDAARDAEQKLSEARASHQADDLKRAHALCTELLATTHRNAARELLLKVEAALDARVNSAREAFAAGESEEALRILASVEEVRPDWPALVSLKTRAARSGGRRAARDRSQAREGEPRFPKGDAHVESARTYFAAGETERAFEALQKSPSDQARELEKQIQQFSELYAGGLREHRAKRAVGAIALLQEANGLQVSITRGKGPLAAEVGRKLADMHYVAGIEAYLEGDLKASFGSFSAAVYHCKAHKPSRRKLDELRKKAELLLADAMETARSEPAQARQKLRLVTEITSPKDALHQRAKQRLGAKR